VSAIQMTCPECGTRYLAGMVGRQPWPAHLCPELCATCGHPRRFHNPSCCCESGGCNCRLFLGGGKYTYDSRPEDPQPASSPSQSQRKGNDG
jgi:hypothetical protein